MANENETAAPVARPATEILGKLSVLTLGIPAAALADENVNKATMGTIVGRATGIVRRSKKNEQDGTVEKMRGFKGSFQAIPADGKRPISRSGILYLPEGLGGAALERLEEAEKDGEIISLDFALECFVIRAKNPAGYSWGGRSLLPETEDVQLDPVAEIMQRVTEAKTAGAITDQSGKDAAPATDAPAKEPEKAAAPASEPNKGKGKN